MKWNSETDFQKICFQFNSIPTELNNKKSLVLEGVLGQHHSMSFCTLFKTMYKYFPPSTFILSLELHLNIK